MAKVVYIGEKDCGSEMGPWYTYHAFNLTAVPIPPPIDSSFFHRLKKRPPLTKISLRHFLGYSEQFLETLPEALPMLQDLYLEIPVIDTLYLEMMETPQDWWWPNLEAILNNPPTHEEVLRFAERFPDIAVHCYQVSYPQFYWTSAYDVPKPNHYVGKRWSKTPTNPKITEILK